MSEGERRQVRTVFFVSNWTGITAETFGHSLLTQFQGIEFRPLTVPFLRSAEKAQELAERINRAAREEGHRPLVFSTLLTKEARAIVQSADCLYIDFFGAFIEPLERELGRRSSPASGRAHAVHDLATYTRRIDAVNFALANDDGVITKEYHRADVILVGVSRSGKTPTCLYLALRYGVYAANYPLTDEDFASGKLPAALLEHKAKLYGLTIEPQRLQSLRTERRSDSRYSSPRQVRYEVEEAAYLFDKYRIPNVDVTHCSVEEIATTVLDQRGLQRRFY